MADMKKPSDKATPSTTDPTIAVAFGGGGARGYAHIHIIEVLDEMGIKPVAVSGASIGAIMGAAVASGISGKEIREYSLELASNRTGALTRYVKARPSGFKNMFNSEFSIGQLDARTMLKAFLPEQIKKTFAELEMPLSVSATDYYGFKETVYTDGDLIDAVAASASIPAVFRPVQINGRYMVDGGIYNPVPFDHLIGRADVVIGIDVVGTPIGDATKAPKAIDSIYGASQLMMQSILSHKLAMSPPDIFLRPNISKYRVQDFFKAQNIIDDSIGVRDELKRSLDAAMNKIIKS
ncbi:patatin-like phospholipase family protein [Ahrensia sp. 13_GOM-1096m]|uniref:patatin-like phospholipase family protein n=1 Tax=Ahrensia sp. 13_GOM-1096m TaxID=1380380 RepID=UPI00047CB770|nr:patatin-like phospholipase family protein [Ahrensia sp. 13_GOM-1096m]